MGNSNGLGNWRLPVVALVAGVIAERNYRRLPMARRGDSLPTGKVSIVVPARNEEQRIGPLLRSLQQIAYRDLEIVVVDDESEDGTAHLARSLGARVIPSGPLPDGWTGKSHACWQGAAGTSGEWLLFTDADTVHQPRSLEIAISVALSTGSDLVSFLCQQQCESFWERLLLPYAYALYFVGRLQMNVSTRSAVANGQYILMRRAAYERIGGHQAVRGSAIDDVALARTAHAAGVQVLLLRGEQEVGVRMYQDLSSIWEGMSKNSAHFMAISPSYGSISVAASVLFSAALPQSLRTRASPGGVAAYAAPALALTPWLRRFGVPMRYALIYPLAAMTFQLLAFDSIRRGLARGGVRWKGRRY